MSKKPDQSKELDTQCLLRAKAETELARVQPAAAPSRSAEELLHELQVYQVELEMQNEELRQALISLEESLDHYRDFYDFAPVDYLTLTNRGLISEINLAGAALLGMECGKLLWQRLARFVTPKDRDRWHQYLLDTLNRDTKLSCELAFKRGDGSGIAVQLDCLRLVKEGEVPVIRVALTNITWRKQIEEVVREQKDFFRMIAENIDEFIVVLDLKGQRIYSNPAYDKFFGAAETMKDADSFATIHPDDREYIEHAFRETVQTGISLRTEFRYVLADGSIRHMESCGGAIRDNEGQVSRVVVVSHDVTAHKQEEEAIHILAFYDTLTGLPNRRLLEDRLIQAMAAGKRSGRYCAVIFLDLDNFKPLNDEYGHTVGDLLLVEAAHRIRSCVREVDTVVRFGGDEFVALLSELNIDKTKSIAEVSIIAEKIRNALEQPYVLTIQQDGKAKATIEHYCTSSIGVEIFINHEITRDDIIIHADLAMYQAKQNGRNRICFFDANAQLKPVGNVAATRHRAKERSLRVHQTGAKTTEILHELPVHQIKLDLGVELESNSSTAPADRQGKVP